MASSDVIMQVVKYLNEEPFKMDLSLVAFDDKSPYELLQLLNDVVAHLDESHYKDIRTEVKAVTAARLCRMLQTLRFPFPGSGSAASGSGAAGGGSPEAFYEKLADGAKDAVYPALHYLLSKREILKKRAYIAKFLSRIELPPEFMHDEQVQEQLQVLRSQQQEFKTAHKAVEQLRSRSKDPAELRKDKQQLDTERAQLRDRIAQQSRSTAEVPGFKALLAATTAMRHEQEEESKLQERMHAQRQQLQQAEHKYLEATRRLAETRANTREDASAERLLEIARAEAQEGRRLLQEGLPAALASRREALQQLQNKLREAPRTDADVHAMQAAVAESEAQVKRLSQEVADAQQKAGQSSLVVSRYQGALVASRLAEKEEALEVLRQRAEEARRAVDAREAVLQQMSGPRYMRRDDFQRYRYSLLAKSQEVKRSKAELGRLQAETVVLARTEQLLKSRASGVDSLMKKLEERRGVAGYTGVQASLEELSKQKAAVDATKGKTLEEISRIVTDISQSLAVRKEKLAPQIEDLRAVRMEYSELEARYVGAKRRFDSTRAGLAAQRAELERLCDQLQEDLIDRGREAETLRMRATLMQEQLDRAERDTELEAGDKRLMRDFKTWKELLTTRAGQLETTAKTLRQRQRHINDNAGALQREKQSYVDVEKLLQWKLEAYRSGQLGRTDEDDSAGGGGIPGAAGGSQQVDGANVITIE